jgi:hypothetical protein
MRARSDIRELNALCDSSPIHELWVEVLWRSWKYALRAVGKRDCIAAIGEAVGRLDVPLTYPNYTGTGNLPYDVHDRIKVRLYVGLIDWLRCDTTDSRCQVAVALAEYDEAVAVEQAKAWFVVCSDVPPIKVFASISRAIIAKSSFEVHIRQALYESDSVNPGSSKRFRHQLLKNRLRNFIN